MDKVPHGKIDIRIGGLCLSTTPGIVRASMVSYNGTKYTYVHNLHENIVGTLDASGSLIVEYT